jgi:hypothetical protein
MTYHKNFRAHLPVLRKLWQTALLTLFIASCAPDTTGPSDPASGPDGSNGGSASKQVDTSQSTSHSKNTRTQEETLGVNLFVVDNASSQALGDITIPSLLDTQYLAVGPSQVDTTAIPFTPALVLVNFQVCSYPNTTVVILPSGAQVAVGWPTPNLISVLDYDQQD